MESKGSQFKYTWRHMSILSTWWQRDINQNMTISTSHNKNKKRSYIKHQTGIYIAQCISSKETKKYMITLHIPHIKELSEEEDDKLLDLVVPSILWHRISWKMTVRTLNVDTCNSTLKSGRKMEWSNGKSNYTIRFVASNNVKSIVKFLNSNEVKI